MKRKAKEFAMVVAVMILASASMLNAQAMMGDFPLSGSVDTSKAVKLVWDAPSGVTVSNYYIYRVPMSQPDAPVDSAHAVLVDSTQNRYYIDHPPVPAIGGYGYMVRAKTNMGIKQSNGIFIGFGAQQSMLIMLTVSPSDTGKGFHLKWSVPMGVTISNYYIYRVTVSSPDTKPDSASFKPIDSTTGTQYVDYPAPLQVGGYLYLVRGKTNTGAWVASNPVFIGMAGSMPMWFKLTASREDSGKVELNWDAPQNFNVSYYLLFRGVATGAMSLDSIPFSRVDSFGVINQYRDHPPTLQNGGTYVYRLRAYSNTGTSTWSSPALVYIPPFTVPETFRLFAQLDTTGGKRTAKLSWMAVANATVLKYYVYRATLEEPGAPVEKDHMVLIDSTNGLTSTDSLGQSVKGAIAYVVRAQLSDRSITSNVAVIVLGPIQMMQYLRLNAEVGDSGRPRLNWEVPQGVSFVRFYIWRGVAGENGALPAQYTLIDSTTTKPYIDRTIPATNHGYVYRVTGWTGMQMVESNPAFVLMSDKIMLAAIVDLDGGSVKLEWSKPTVVQPAYYIVWRSQIDNNGALDTLHFMRVDSVVNNEYVDHPPGSTGKGYVYLVHGIINANQRIVSNLAGVRWSTASNSHFSLQANVDRRSGKVELEWEGLPSFTIAKFYVYRATLAKNNPRIDSTTAFSLIDSTMNTHAVDKPATDQSNLFAYYVEAVGTNGNHAKTNFSIAYVMTVPAGGMDRVAITSEPVRLGRIGTLYVYQPTAVTSDSTAVIKWALKEAPPGMTIDTATGLIQWTPAVKGWAEVAVAAFSSKGGRAIQEYHIAVAGGSGAITGVVTDTLGNPLRAVVKLLKRDIESSFEYRTVTDSTGAYHFDVVDVGSYLAYAAAFTGDYIPEWYYRQRSPNLATPIVVADSSSTTVNFHLQSRQAVIPFYSLSGTVVDTLNKPIGGALVMFARAEFLLNSAKHEGDSEEQAENFKDVFSHLAQQGQASLSSASGYVFRVMTDSSGYYSLRMPRGSYIGLSYAVGYRKIFYSQRTDLLSADVVKLTTDTTNINFLLAALPQVALGSISGSVADTSSGMPVPARVIVFRSKNGQVLADSYFGDTDTLGRYTVTDLLPGDYYVLALPLGRYAPSFYSLTGATTHWQKATTVSINGNAVSGIDIIARPIASTVSGYTYIQGGVTSNGPSGSANLRKRVTIGGVNGSLVYATDSLGQVVGYGVSDATGAYTISGIAPGTYSVYTDRIGYNASSSGTASPTYSASGAAVPGSSSFTITQSTTDVETVTAEIPQEYRLEQNFPNPFNPTTQISFSLPKDDHVTIAIYNLLGQRVSTLVDGTLRAGLHQMTWNARSDNGIPLSTGVYFYQIRSGSFVATKKMILLK